MQQPLVSIIIPHFNGEAILMRCLQSLAECTDYPHEIIIVNNASTDGSVTKATQQFPQIHVINSDLNLGYAGGCNLGMDAARGDFYLLLNNDAIVSPAWLNHLMAFALKHPEYGALQPKIQSIDNAGYFDYAGAAGGMLDIFGFPFSRGRLFFTIEKDENQYDHVVDLFWASGTCTLLRKQAITKVGKLDSDFFAHMEEIDLNWRMLLTGFKIGFVSQAVIKHNAGSTLAQNSPGKIFLNHRNSLEMVLKNYEISSIFMFFPVRMLLEFVAILFAVVKFDFAQAGAIIRACFAVLGKLPAIAQKRQFVNSLRKCSDREIRSFMFRGSIVYQYFIKGKKTYSSLNCDKSKS